MILSSVKSSFGEEAVCLYPGGSTFLNRVPKIVSLYGGAQSLVVCFQNQGNIFVEKLCFEESRLIENTYLNTQNGFNLFFKIFKLQLPH